jgi:hypothetical protein
MGNYRTALKVRRFFIAPKRSLILSEELTAFIAVSVEGKDSKMPRDMVFQSVSCGLCREQGRNSQSEILALLPQMLGYGKSPFRDHIVPRRNNQQHVRAVE